MRLIIKNNRDHANMDSYIVDWVIPSLQLYIWSKLDIRLLRNYKHIYEEDKLLTYIKQALQSLEMIKVGYPQTHQYEIRINPNVFCDSKTAKLYDICSLVNYGSLSCPAYPIFTKSFDFFAVNFWKFYRLYQLGVLQKNGRKII